MLAYLTNPTVNQNIQQYLVDIDLRNLSETSLELSRTIYRSRLNLQNITNLSKSIINSPNRFSQITTLNLDHTQVNNKILQYIGSIFLHLKHLSLQGCNNFTDYGLLYLGPISWQLEYLNLSNCHQLTTQAGFYLTPHNHWIIHNCVRTVSRYFQDLTKKCFSCDLYHREYKCPQCRKAENPSFHMDQVKPVRMKYLNVSGCNMLKHQTFLEIAINYISLEHLDLSHLPNLRQVDLQHILERCPCIRVLNLSHTKTFSVGINLVVKNLPYLEELDCSYTMVCNDGMEILGFSKLGLTKLNISGNNNITDLGLFLIGIGSYSLQEIVLSDLQNISRYGLKLLLERQHYFEKVTVDLIDYEYFEGYEKVLRRTG